MSVEVEVSVYKMDQVWIVGMGCLRWNRRNTGLVFRLGEEVMVLFFYRPGIRDVFQCDLIAMEVNYTSRGSLGGR